MAQIYKLLIVAWLAIAYHGIPEISTTVISEISTTAIPEISTTAIPEISTTAIPEISTTAIPETSTTGIPETSTTGIPETSTTGIPETSTTGIPEISTTAIPEISTTAIPEISTTAIPEISTTGIPEISTTGIPETSTTGIPETSPTNSTTNVSSTATTPSSTTVPTDPCLPNPCGSGSTCSPRFNNTFLCLCLSGQSYNEITTTCQNSRVFPGQLSLKKLEYTSGMSNPKSEEFQKASKNITDELDRIYSNTAGYVESIVLDINPLPSNPASSRKKEFVIASVEIIFEADSDINTTTVSSIIEAEKNCENCFLNGASFEAGDPCAKNDCDLKTTKCIKGDGRFSCKCTKDYVKSNYTDKTCTACPSGEKATDEGCKACTFGRSGFNCTESWELVLVIVGSLLGGLLIITLILLGVISHKSKKKSKKDENTDIGKPYISHSATKAPFVDPAKSHSAFASAGVPRIPRAAASNGWDHSSNLEMTPSNSRQNLIPGGRNSRTYDRPDEWNVMNGSSQNRAQTNRYAQNRAQMNPYAQSQGQTNPYYMQDNGRRFN
ncbi:hypothetical protein LDENG_00100380 [Lucifuga dentata]|nr:hypothetical protein LDENG_00100380 [Lucifuga dentata]